MFCTHGSKVDTTEQLIYPPGSFPSNKTEVMNVNNDTKLAANFWPFPASDPTIIKGDGDGTVNIRSLEVSNIPNKS